jgi:ComF family protein
MALHWPAWWLQRYPALPWAERLSLRLLAPRCLACGEPAAPCPLDLCDVCLATLPLRPMPTLEVPGVAAHLHCIPCRYAEPVAGWLRRLKYGGDWRPARVLGALLAASRAATGQSPPQLIVPLPLHAARERERGFNQAERLATAAARWLAVPVARHALVRSRATLPQTRLDAAARRRNLAGAFELQAAWAEGSALPRHVALVDDVVTTGATLADAVRALRRHGVQTLEVWAVARAELARAELARPERARPE